MTYEYECAMTGLTREGGAEEEFDGLGDLPVGWTRVRITRRAYNPRWVMIQQVKEAMVANMLQQMPPEAQAAQRHILGVQVDAQFHALESDTPMFLPDIDEVVYLSGSGDIVDSVNEMREMLGLEPLVTSDDHEDVNDEEMRGLMAELGDSLGDEDEDDEDDE